MPRTVEVPEYEVHEEVRVDPARTALIVVDMQNDFVKEGGSLVVPDAAATIPAIRLLLGRQHISGSIPLVPERTKEELIAVAERRAEVVWEGDLARGGGKFSVGSGAMGEMPVIWASRTERSDGKTSPEELIAAAHASCFSMALSNVLAEGGTPPERLRISTVCTFDVETLKVSSVDLDIRGRVPGIDAEDFQNAVEQADQGCPVSNALRGNVDIRVNASLDEG
jgi:lipoyl-dependent peroxiredoxin